MIVINIFEIIFFLLKLKKEQDLLLIFKVKLCSEKERKGER